MTYLLDTNILIYLLKNHPRSVAEHINNLPASTRLSMSFFTYAELLKGAERSTRKQQVMRQLALLVRQIPVLYAGSALLCQHYAVQFNRLKAAGTPIGANDLWIGCHALAENAVLVTNNTREFERIVGLQLENWV
ncbi:type II toxin-antitoxin system VapC family toxin [Chromatiaceae bacterium AAb-1]|nr:type II toxin-antitoxin system VapC family toxin [Chromatiaceae bacterium AAb-1]